MKLQTRFLFGALAATAGACQGPVSAPPQWTDIENVPAGFQDGKDDVRSDEEIRAAVKGHFVETEADPVFGASAAATITNEHVAEWDAVAEAGDHRTAGYLKEESDPAFAASPAAAVTTDDVLQWRTAALWGDHAQAGYLKAESDPAFAASAAAAITVDKVTRWETAFSWGNHASAGYLKAESDPAFTASPAASITTDKVNHWDAAYGWGNHASAGYLKTESDPAFTASPAGAITTDQVKHWDAAYGWGNHASAGYLKTEADPAFTASPASSITADKVTHWDAAYSWGNHASAGYLKTESDPKIGALPTGAIPTWDGSKLTLGAISETAGNVGIGTVPGAANLTVGTVAKVGFPMVTSALAKTCSTPGFDWTNTPPSVTPCNNYCTAHGFAGGRLQATGSRTAGGARCDYISDFETCTVATMQNNGNCNSQATAFVCTCLEEGTEFSGHVRVIGGNLGIGVSDPQSPLQVKGYLQLGTTTGSPPAADCDATAERGRMLTDPGTGLLWLCTNNGWVSK